MHCIHALVLVDQTNEKSVGHFLTVTKNPVKKNVEFSTLKVKLNVSQVVNGVYPSRMNYAILLWVYKQAVRNVTHEKSHT